MKKMFILALMSAVCLTSCRHGMEEIPEETGTLKLNVSSLTDFITVETKTDGEGGAIDYTNTADYDVVVKGPTPLNMKYSEFSGQVIELGSGDYEITVTSPATEPAAFDQPIYQAHETFTIIAGEVTPLDLTCTPANCKVTIELSENFTKELASYEVIVSNGLGQLVWTKNSEINDFSQDKAGYFLPRGLEIIVNGYRSIDNTFASAVHYIEQTLPAEYHVIKLDAKVTGQIGGIGITVTTDFTEKSEDIIVDGMDEEYVDRPDFGEGDGDDEEEVDLSPVIIWQDNPFFDPIVLGEKNVSMTVKAPRGFKTFVVEVDDGFKPAITTLTDAAYVCEVDEAGEIVFVESTDSDGNPIMVTVKKNFGTDENPIYKTIPHVDWDDDGVVPETVDYIDLINHSFFWYSFNLPVGNEISGKSEVIFDLTPFITALQTAAGGATVSFTLRATDVEDNFVMTENDELPVVTITVPKN